LQRETKHGYIPISRAVARIYYDMQEKMICIRLLTDPKQHNAREEIKNVGKIVVEA
jgi:hypothetical protein